jgi:glycosyltransferase involved in cell wall biosynthesis
MSPLRVLITNMWLKRRSGTEIVTIELAKGLARRGHEVVVFAHDLGASGEMLRLEGIRVADRLDDLAFAPDVIQTMRMASRARGKSRPMRSPPRRSTETNARTQPQRRSGPGIDRLSGHARRLRLSRSRSIAMAFQPTRSVARLILGVISPANRCRSVRPKR